MILFFMQSLPTLQQQIASLGHAGRHNFLHSFYKK